MHVPSQFPIVRHSIDVLYEPLQAVESPEQGASQTQEHVLEDLSFCATMLNCVLRRPRLERFLLVRVAFWRGVVLIRLSSVGVHCVSLQWSEDLVMCRFGDVTVSMNGGTIGCTVEFPKGSVAVLVGAGVGINNVCCVTLQILRCMFWFLRPEYGDLVWRQVLDRGFALVKAVTHQTPCTPK